MKKISLYILILLILLPVFILYTGTSVSSLVSSWPSIFLNLGKIAGLLGLACFGFGLLLASRFSWLDRLFAGLPRAINVHRYLGVFSFTFIILHPLLLASQFLKISQNLPWQMFLYWTDIAYIFGYLALLAFMTLVLITFFARMRYELLKSIHSLMAVPLMLSGMHALLIESDVKRSIWLSSYFIILITIGVVAYLARLYLVQAGRKARNYIVEKIEYPTGQTVKVSLRPVQKGLTCDPGQFIFISFPGIQKGEEHPFSITETDPSGQIVIIAKVLGDFTQKMKDLKPGAKAIIDGPYGRFGQNIDKNKRQIWIAGGIGITPFLSMARSFVSDKDNQGKVDLFYVVAKDTDLAEIDNLKNMTKVCDRFCLNTYVSDTQGKFDIDKLKSQVRDFSDCDFYICGPSGMIKSFVDNLKKLNISEKRINIEAFKLL